MRRLTDDVVAQRTSGLAAFTYAAIALATMCAPTHAATQYYSIIDLGVPSGFDSSEGIDVNDRGQVATRTWASGHIVGFVWDEGTRTVIDTRFSYNTPHAINDHETVVGFTSASAGDSQGFSWEDGDYVLLGHVPGGQDWTRAHAINNAGLVVGYSLGGSDNSAHFITWQNGQFVDHGKVPVGYDPNPPGQVRDDSEANDVNELGQIVGYSRREEYFGERRLLGRAWIWQDGVVTLLPAFTEESEVYQVATAINNNGQVLGHSFDEAGVRNPVVWTDGAIEMLGDIPNADTYAKDLNDDGLVVGWAAQDIDINEEGAFLWDLERNPHNLNDLLDDSGDGWVLERAHAINNNGCIVGRGINPAGARRGFLLTPVPEPSTFALLAMMTVGLLAYGWRRNRSGEKRS